MGGWHIAALVFSLISLVAYLTALASPHWLEGTDFNVGLWQLCADSSMGTVCTEMGMNVKGYIHATRAFLIMGLFPSFTSCGLLFLLFSRTEIGSYPIQFIAMMSSHVAGILALIAMAIFTGFWGTSVVYGWSVILGWLTVILLHVTGGLARRISSYTPI